MTDIPHKATIIHAPERDLQRERMHPLVHAAMQQTASLADPATLRELLAVQREWEAGESKKAYTRALAQLKADLPSVIAKDATVDFTNQAGKRTYYKHTSLAAVMDAVTEPLTRHGFSLSWTPATSERAIRVTCRLTHTEGHSEEATLDAPADTSGSKSPAQAIASTITLLSRYTALALLGIATRDMTEPTAERDEDLSIVDADQNLRAVKAVVKAGRTRDDAEKHLGRPVSQWTRADLRSLKQWLHPVTSEPST